MKKRNSDKYRLKNIIILSLIICFVTGCTKNEQNVSRDTTVASENVDATEAVNTETGQEENPAEEDEQTAWQKEYETAKIRDYYGGIIQNIGYHSMLPDGRQIERYESFYEDEDYDTEEQFDEVYDKYAIFDVDLDGRDELLIAIENTYVAGQVGFIYSYNPDTGVLSTELSDYPMFTCYSNGAVTMGWSHNQGMGPEFWPFNIYTYDANSDIYMYQGNVDTWDKKYYETDYEDNPFPDSADVDGDGVIYYAEDAQGNGYKEPKDYQEYEKWIQSYIGDGEPVEIPWQDIKYENYSDYYKDNVKMFLQQYKEKDLNAGTDIGLMFMESDNLTATVEQIQSLMQNQYGVQMNELTAEGLDFVYAIEGILDGVTVFNTSKEGPENVAYRGKQVGDITICGLYPGMTEEEGKNKLLEAGFYNMEYGYQTGNMEGDFSIYLTTDDNGVITDIYINMICYY